ncbi:MAG: peptidase E [Anaerolineales bacterium]|nr:peptidase E [Anaerolineales bacterium]
MQQIIAVGAGYLAVGRSGMHMEQYLISATGKRKPRTCFLPTASADAPDYVASVQAAFGYLGVKVDPLYLLKPNTADVERFLSKYDLIFVGGGNTRNMLALWRAWGVDAALRKAYNRGAVLAGGSAGAICWFEQGLTDSVPGKLLPMDCLGWLPGSCCPHYDSEPGRRPAYRKLVATGKVKAGLALDDLGAVHYINGKLHAALAFGRGARVHQVRRVKGKLSEALLPTTTA